MKSIAILIYRMGVGGAERLIVDDIHEFLRRGHAVHLITFTPEQSASFMADVPFECSKTLVQFRSLFDIRAIYALATVLKERKPDVVVTHLWFANTVGRVAARLCRCHKRVLTFEHNVYDEVKTWKQFLIDKLLQWWCIKIIAVSDEVKTSLVLHGISAKRVGVIPNAIDTTRFENARSFNIRSELEIPDNSFVYLFVGRLTRQKGVDILLEAFMRQKNNTLLIAGDGEDRATLISQAARLGIRDRVHFLGVRDDIPVLMRSSDCFVFPSRWEGHSIAIIEAMVAGLPLVVSDFEAGRGIFVDEHNALVVPRENADALAHAMERMCFDATLRARLSERGRIDAARYSVSMHVSMVLECLSE